MLTNRSRILLLPSLIFGMFVFNSCEKETITYTPTLPFSIPDKSFSADVDGSEFVDTVLWGVEEAGNISITASMDGDFPKIILVVPNTIQVGSYQMGGSTSTQKAFLKFGTAANEQFSSELITSNLIITEHNTEANYIVGTFDFIAIPSSGNTSTLEFDVTNGTFTVSY